MMVRETVVRERGNGEDQEFLLHGGGGAAETNPRASADGKTSMGNDQLFLGGRAM